MRVHPHPHPHPRPNLRLVAIALAAVVGACTSDSSVGPSQPVTLDKVFSEMSLSSVAPATSTAAATVAPVPVPALSAVVPSSCSYDGTSKFVCAPVTASGVTVTRAFTLLDASNTPQSQFDPATTAAVRTFTTVAGTFTAGPRSVTINSQETMTLSGLLTGVHTLDGASVAHLSSPASGTTPAFNTDVTTTIDHLVLPTDSNKYPAGTITMDATSALNSGTPQPTLGLRMVFDGTSTAKMTITVGGFASQTCTIDLASQTPACK